MKSARTETESSLDGTRYLSPMTNTIRRFAPGLALAITTLVAPAVMADTAAAKPPAAAKDTAKPADTAKTDAAKDTKAKAKTPAKPKADAKPAPAKS
jgi:hypothetical protein